MRHHIQIGSSLRDRYHGLQIAERPHLEIFQRRICSDLTAIYRKSREDIRPDGAEPGWHDSDWGAERAIQIEGLTQNSGIAVELTFPKLVPHHEYRRRARRSVGRRNQAPNKGLTPRNK